MSEVRYEALSRQFPAVAEALFDKAEKEAMARFATYQRLADQDKIPVVTN